MSNKRGFAALSPEQRRDIAAQGGRKKVSKGIGKLTPEKRVAMARFAANERWKRAREAQTDNQVEVAGD